jgi:O-antigen/teichoic acid export membrane protein
MRWTPPAARGGFLRGGALVLASTLVWHLSNFAFNSVSARLLGPASYGSLAAVVAVLYVAGPLFVSIQTVTCRLTIRLATRDEWERLRGLLRYYGVRLSLAALALATAVVISSSTLAGFLHVPSELPIAILGIAFLFAAMTHLQRGVLQGSLRFGRYAVSTLSEATAKIVATVVLLLWVWRSIEAAVLAIAIGGLVAIVVNWLLLGYLPKTDGEVEPVGHPFRYSLVTLSCLLLLALLLSVDLLAAKRYLDPHDAGVYAAVSLAGKIIFFATSALTLYLFPLFSDRQERGLDARRPLVNALKLVVAASSLLVIAYFAVPGIVIGPLFGSSYSAAGAYIGWMAIAFAAYAVVYLTAMYLLSQENGSVNSILGLAVLVQLAGLYTLHSTIWAIVAVEVAVLASTALVLSVVALQARSVSSPAPEPA